MRVGVSVRARFGQNVQHGRQLRCGACSSAVVHLARVGKAGTPERPLSDMGLVGYRSYWAQVLLRILQACNKAQRIPPQMSIGAE
eukprot:5369308-Pleurochrysis_carterae.AAC.1